MQTQNFVCCGNHLADLDAVMEHFEDCHGLFANESVLAGQNHNALFMSTPMIDRLPTRRPDDAFVHSSHEIGLAFNDIGLEMGTSSLPSSGGPTPLMMYSPYPDNSPFHPNTPDSYIRFCAHHKSVSADTSPPSDESTRSNTDAHDLLPPDHLFHHSDMPEPQRRFTCATPSVKSPPVSAFDTIVISQPPQQIHTPSPLWPAEIKFSDVSRAHSTYSSLASCIPGYTPTPPAHQERVLLEQTLVVEPHKLPGHSLPTMSPSLEVYEMALSVPDMVPMVVVYPSTAALAKPFRCPTPHCIKRYKQGSGLRYHITHGTCKFFHIVAGVDKAQGQLQPYTCGITDCKRRYKTLGGLKYHYRISNHPNHGVALLASDQQGTSKSAKTRAQRNNKELMSIIRAKWQTIVGGTSTNALYVTIEVCGKYSRHNGRQAYIQMYLE